MVIARAETKDMQKIAELDSHIPPARLEECIRSGRVYVLKDDTVGNGAGNNPVTGVLRYSLFWQTIPFLDLLYIGEAYRRKGYGSRMMREWERAMRLCGYEYVMTSTQSDEDAWRFYEKLGYRRAGGFFPPGQDAEEWMYRKELEPI